MRWLVVAAEPVTSVDVTAADTLAELDRDFAGDGIELRFAELKDPVKDKLKRFGLFAEFGEELLSDHRRGRRQLSREPHRGLGGLGGPRLVKNGGVIGRR